MYAARHAIGAYVQAGIETSVVDANPHRLITMLFEGAHAAINLASAVMQRNEVPVRVWAFDRAISIISQGLQIDLGRQRSGETAVQPNNLCDYMLRCLLLVNANNDLTILAEVDASLVPLQDV